MLNNSPSIVTDGLILYYDMNNVKSFTGSPTSNQISLTDGYPTTGKNIIILSGTGAGQINTIASYATGTVTFSANWSTIPDSTSVYGIITNNSVINQCTVLGLASVGTFIVGNSVTGSSSGAVGYIAKYDSGANLLYLTNITGSFTTADTVNTIHVNSVTAGTAVPNIGDVLYFENRTAINRYPDQIEDVKVVIEF